MRPLLVLSALVLTYAAVRDGGPSRFASDQIKGAWLAPVGNAPLEGPAADAELRRLRALGATHVAFGPEVVMADVRRPSMSFGSDDAGLRTVIRAARRAGLGVFLLPRIESPSFFVAETRPGEVRPWRGDLEMTSPADWTTFFENYRRMIAHYGALAREEGVAWLSIGLEYRKTVKKHPAEWRRVAAAAKDAFGGPITYSANWDDYDQIEWWDAVDAIGIGAYFELVPEPAPEAPPRRGSLAEALAGWAPIRDRLKAFSLRWNRPILFTEVGYTGFEDAIVRPWQWQQTKRTLDPSAQADAWRALFRTFAGEPWWRGVFVWRFYTDRAAVPAWDYAPGPEAEHVISATFRR
jgi:hypothetical protein